MCWVNTYFTEKCLKELSNEGSKISTYHAIKLAKEIKKTRGQRPNKKHQQIVDKDGHRVNFTYRFDEEDTLEILNVTYAKRG